MTRSVARGSTALDGADPDSTRRSDQVVSPVRDSSSARQVRLGSQPAVPERRCDTAAMSATSDREENEIRLYVSSQTPPDSGDEVTLVQKVGQRRVAGRDNDLYDVRISSGARWWVITDMTNL